MGSLWVVKAFYDEAKIEKVCWTTPGKVPAKIESKLPICALLASAKPCLCLPFHWTPGVLASTWCSQNALWCHLFKHSELLANRDKPLFIKPLILAARMTTWLVLKGALKSFIGVVEEDLYSWRKALRAKECNGGCIQKWGDGLCLAGVNGTDWIYTVCQWW